MPFSILNEWLNEEKDKGAPNPNQAILSTVSGPFPHSRVVAIREIKDGRLLFFTQRVTRKVSEMVSNPNVSLVYWFELSQKSVTMEGLASPLSLEENEEYWRTYPREAQIRFSAYAPTSAKPILEKQVLENKRTQIREQFEDADIPFCSEYCGFSFDPKKITFYAYNVVKLSDVSVYDKTATGWQKTLLSP